MRNVATFPQHCVIVSVWTKQIIVKHISLILTSWNQVILCCLGLALMLHSKYTSSPSLMSSGLSVLPRWSTTCGGSGSKQSQNDTLDGVSKQEALNWVGHKGVPIVRVWMSTESIKQPMLICGDWMEMACRDSSIIITFHEYRIKAVYLRRMQLFHLI